MVIDFLKEKEVVCISGFFDDLTYGKVYQIQKDATSWGEHNALLIIKLLNDRNIVSDYPIKSSGLYNFLPQKLYRKIKIKRLKFNLI